MRKLFTISCLLFIITILPVSTILGQGYIQFSKLEGAPGAQTTISPVQVVNGEIYAFKDVSPPGYNSFQATITKYATDGSVIYSTDIGPEDPDNFYYSMNVINGEVYLLGGGYNLEPGTIGLPVKFIVVKLSANGTLIYKNFIGGTEYRTYLTSINPEHIIGNEMLLSGNLERIDYSNPNWVGAWSFITKISLADGTITRSMIIPYSSCPPEVENGAIYTASSYGGNWLPVTMGNVPPANAAGGIYIQKLNASDFSIIYARFVSEATSSFLSSILVHNGELHMTGYTNATNFAVTNNTTLSTSGQDGFYTKLNADGTIAVSTYYAVPGFQASPDNIIYSNGNVYLTGSIFAPPSNGGRFIYKLKADGSTGWFKQFSASSGSPYVPNQQILQVIGDDVYMSGVGVAADFPVTNGSHYAGATTTYFTHFNAAGNTIFSTFLTAMESINYESMLMQIHNNKIYLACGANIANYPPTDSSSIKGESDIFICILNPDGSCIYSSYIGGNTVDMLYTMSVDNGSIFISGATNSTNFPVTDNVLLQGIWDGFLTKISFCPDNYVVSADTLSPKIQTGCKNGLADTIHGNDLAISGSGLPVIYLNGVATQQQYLDRANYQWQTATAVTGPWTNIPNATQKDFRPIIGGVDRYYRRNVFTSAACGSAFIHTSDTAVVLAGAFTAPTLNAGTDLVTCPSTAINIGGSPTATGGTPPYAYNWDQGLQAVANPTVSPLTNSIYTLKVTDAAGCEQIAQALVLVYKANAGSDKSSCAGIPVKIGEAPIAGLPGVNYLWQPATGLDNTNIAQPFANPVIQTDYDLTLTIPKTGGGTCVTYDTVRVTAVAAPVDPNFAGTDKVICVNENVLLGTSAEPGFTYTWSPLTYLTNINNSNATYDPNPGPTDYIPTPDPAHIYLSAYKNGCTFSDEVTVSTIESRAGKYECNEVVTLAGMPDRTPNISEIYSWTLVSGPGNFTGATNLPQVPVAPFTESSSVYGLTVSYNGKSCYSETHFAICNCIVTISVDPPNSCPGFAANNGDITLHASSNIDDAVYSWTPQVGLSTYTGNTVQLTDNVQRIYTVTATSAHDSTIHCSQSIEVNDPALTAPVFHAPDTATCAGVPVMIGLPSVAGYTYHWEGFDLSDLSIGNPIATVSYTTQYQVSVTTVQGCTLRDTVIVFVQDTPAYAGDDWLICSNAIATLGSAQMPNTTYLWEPQISAWQNGTSQFSAQPQVLAATSVTYTLTTTTSAGCVSTDEVNITVNNNPVIPDAPDLVSCPGLGGYQIGSPAIPAVTYQWSPTAGLDDPTAAQPIADPSVNTTYTVIATFPGACNVAPTDQVTVTVNNPFFDMPDIHFCPGDGPVTLGANAPAGMSYYSWDPQALLTNANIANPSTMDPPPHNTTIFTLTVANQFGCYYRDTLSIIPFTEAPVAGADRTACRNQAVNIGAASNATGPSISYSWSPVAYLDDPSSPNPVFTGTLVGTFQYTLTKTDNSIACSISDTIVINVVDILPALNSPTVCRNNCIQIGTNPVIGINYLWSPANGLSDPSIADPVACIDTVGATYTLTASDQAGCVISADVVIGVNGVPGLQVSVPGIIACVGDLNVMFNPSTPPGAYSYLWSPDNGTLSDINIPNPVIQITSPGITQYILQITDNTTGCTNTVTGNVTVNNCSPYAGAGNFMWFDSNENGIQDNGELGVSGAVVKLYNNIGFNMATTVTDAYGAYNFNDIPPGNDYYIIFDKPAGYVFTTQNAGGITATNNSKADDNGRTGNFNLITGEDISNMDAGIKPGQIVPITLLSFTARLQNNRTVLLNWQTTAEINNHYFDVEGSIDETGFSTIGRVDGNGTTSLPHNYSLIDPHPLNGFNYYRLRQVDFDGHSTYSHIEAVELKNNEIVTAWYNNQNNSIQLLFNNNQHNLDIKLYASNGQLLKSASATNNIVSYTLDLPILSAGVYMLQVVSEKLRYSKKIFIGK